MSFSFSCCFWLTCLLGSYAAHTSTVRNVIKQLFLMTSLQVWSRLTAPILQGQNTVEGSSERKPGAVRHHDTPTAEVLLIVLGPTGLVKESYSDLSSVKLQQCKTAQRQVSPLYPNG